MKSAGNVFFLARSPEAPKIVTVSVRSQGTPGRTSSRVEAETRRSRRGDEAEVESEGEAIAVAGVAVVVAAPSLAAKALLVELISGLLAVRFSLSVCEGASEESAEGGGADEIKRRGRERKTRAKKEQSVGNNWLARVESIEFFFSVPFTLFFSAPAAFSFDSLPPPAESPRLPFPLIVCSLNAFAASPSLIAREKFTLSPLCGEKRKENSRCL